MPPTNESEAKVLYLRGIDIKIWKEFNHECIDLQLSQADMFNKIWKKYRQNKARKMLSIPEMNVIVKSNPLYRGVLKLFNTNNTGDLEQQYPQKASLILEHLEIVNNTCTLKEIDQDLIEEHNSHYQLHQPEQFNTTEINSINTIILNYFYDQGFKFEANIGEKVILRKINVK